MPASPSQPADHGRRQEAAPAGAGFCMWKMEVILELFIILTVVPLVLGLVLMLAGV